jgi:D-amino-acid dehydrogenase
MRPASDSVLVVGAGVIGHACALALQQRGARVTLVDPDRARIAPSWGNAGHIATEQTEPLASPAMLRSALRRHVAFGGPLDIRNPIALAPWIARYVRACLPSTFKGNHAALRGLLSDALPAWRRLAARLQAPQLLQETGHWVCWESAASASRRERAWRATDVGTARFAPLAPARLARLQAAMAAPLAGGIAFEGTAQIADPLQLADALSSAFERAGGERRHDTVEALVEDGARLRVRIGNGDLLNADRVLVCAGVRSRDLLESLGIRTPLVAERGYHLQWSDHDWPDLPPVVFEDRSMIVTRFRGGLRAAGFVEYTRRDTPPDPRKWQRLAHHVEQLGLPVRGEPSLWYGARPTLPDYLPAIGRSRRFPALHYAFGHQHLGLTLAAVTGERIAALLDGGSDPSASAFAIERFARGH